MCDDPRSARRSWRSLFPFDVDPRAREPPSSSPPALVTLPQSQSASHSTNLLPPPQLKNKSPAQEMDAGKPAQRPRAGEPSPGIAVYEKEEEVEEGEKASANDGVQEEEKTKALKADLPASGPESTPQDVAAGEKKKAMPKGKGAVVRVWSAEDEVRILECLAAFVEAHGAPPARSELHGVIHGHVLDKRDFTLTEIYEKVRRLRDRYYTMRDTAAAGAPPRGDAEDLQKYQISRKIWGDSLVLPKREKKENGSHEAPKTPVRRQFEELRRLYPHLTLAVEEIAAGHRGCLKRAYELMDDSKARELDAKVKKQRVLEMQMQQDRSSAQMEVMRALLE